MQILCIYHGTKVSNRSRTQIGHLGFRETKPPSKYRYSEKSRYQWENPQIGKRCTQVEKRNTGHQQGHGKPFFVTICPGSYKTPYLLEDVWDGNKHSGYQSEFKRHQKRARQPPWCSYCLPHSWASLVGFSIGSSSGLI